MTIHEAIQRHSGMSSQQIQVASYAPEHATGFQSPGSCEAFVRGHRDLVFSTIYTQALERYYEALRENPPVTDADFFVFVARFTLSIAPTL